MCEVVLLHVKLKNNSPGQGKVLQGLACSSSCSWVLFLQCLILDCSPLQVAEHSDQFDQTEQTKRAEDENRYINIKIENADCNK